MADYTDLPDTAVGVGGIPSGTTVTALRDNPIAIAERAVGAPKVLGANYDILDRVVISGTPTAVDLTFDGTNYDEIIINLISLVPATDGSALWLRTSTDGGSTFSAGGSDYDWVKEELTAQTSPSASDTGDNTDAQIVLTQNVGSSSNESVSGKISVLGTSNALYYKPFFSELFYRTTTGVGTRTRGVGNRLSSADIDAVRLLWDNGSAFEDGGIITMYGVRNS